MKATTATGFAALALALTVSACGGGDDVSSDATTTSTTAPIERPTEPVDDTFDVDGVGFHLHCTGEGDTTSAERKPSRASRLNPRNGTARCSSSADRRSICASSR